MTFGVLNPAGRDRDQVFLEGAGRPGDPGHPPVNYHAYAACTHGGFYRDLRPLPAGVPSVLVLLRKRNLRDALKAVQALKNRGTRAFVSLKESGAHQVADFLGDVGRWELFQQICSGSSGAISSTPDLVPLYRAAGCPKVEFIPTPYPLSEEDWNFETPLEKRRGIFVGTREFDVPSRNHLAAVVLADELSREFSCPLAVINTEGRRGGMILKSLRSRNPLLFIIEAPLDYADYLKTMTLHRLVWQLDSSRVPGQVAGDALLCRMPCVGGNGAVDELAFGTAGSPESSQALARKLLSDDAAWTAHVAVARERALAGLSFAAVRKRLESLSES